VHTESVTVTLQLAKDETSMSAVDLVATEDGIFIPDQLYRLSIAGQPIRFTPGC
jgi:hypothetical protein